MAAKEVIKEVIKEAIKEAIKEVLRREIRGDGRCPQMDGIGKHPQGIEVGLAATHGEEDGRRVLAGPVHRDDTQ